MKVQRRSYLTFGYRGCGSGGGGGNEGCRKSMVEERFFRTLNGSGDRSRRCRKHHREERLSKGLSLGRGL